MGMTLCVVPFLFDVLNITAFMYRDTITTDNFAFKRTKIIKNFSLHFMRNMTVVLFCYIDKNRTYTPKTSIRPQFQINTIFFYFNEENEVFNLDYALRIMHYAFFINSAFRIAPAAAIPVPTTKYIITSPFPVP